MKFIQPASGIASAVFVSSCSCAIYNEKWMNESNTRRLTATMVAGAMKDQGFRHASAASGDVEFKKRNSSIRFSSKDQTLLFHSSFCPFPWEIIMDRSSFSEMEAIQGHLIGEFDQQGIRMRKLRSLEYPSPFQKAKASLPTGTNPTTSTLSAQLSAGGRT